MKDWVYYLPVFEVDTYDPQIRTSEWSGHTNFAYDLVRFIKPEKIVELGTHFGTSFFSFCQSVKDGNLFTKCFAIDTWQGDLHSGFYNDDVFNKVSTITKLFYPSMSQLIRSTFDDALKFFEDETVDILHIDGYHTYQAVSHDFSTWLPKLKKNGIVLFHDISVKEKDFGVYKFWDEIKNVYPYLEFVHSSGLGVLFPKGHDEKIENILKKANELQNRYTGNFLQNIDEKNNSLPLVSILIPTYNRPLYFELALQSVLNQTYPNIEIIIGDDSTNDKTKKLVEDKYLPFYKNIRYIKNDENVGQFKNDIMLFNLANGEYINYLMDDDLYTEKKIEKMMNYYVMDKNEEIKLVTSYRKLIDDSGNFSQDIWSTKPLFVVDAILDGKQLGKKMITSQCNFIGEPTTVLFRKKDLIYPFGMFKDRKYLCNIDVASWLTLLSQGKAVYIAEPLSYFRLHINQQLNGPNKIIDGLEDWYHGITIGRQEGFFTSHEDYVIAISNFINHSRTIVELPELIKTSFYQEIFNI
ncbi:hypothetical protein CO726_26165 [Bacillus fungorum]|uniref:Glycosyltransferase 2-like domain-containing protein n=1 Tax=Bacillus fungorum TaxID=2039284 RepID=A0A2G6Q6T4_9BACI|nr:hypothetical protein CO726_26165 [Bacillus fungorum]